jgi:hypothetical protein
LPEIEWLFPSIHSSKSNLLDISKLSEESTIVKSKLKSDENPNDEFFHSKKWLTAKGTIGAGIGIHEWTFEIMQNSHSDMAFGVVIGGDPDTDRCLAGPHSVNTYSRTKNQSLEIVNKNKNENESINLNTPSSDNVQDVKIDNLSDEIKSNAFNDETLEMSWCSNGSLWINNVKKHDSFGANLFPLKMHSCVTIRVNLFDHTISYIVNGELVGIAFGIEGSGALVNIDIQGYIEHTKNNSKKVDDEKYLIFPAASIATLSQAQLQNSNAPPMAFQSIKIKNSVFLIYYKVLKKK